MSDTPSATAAWFLTLPAAAKALRIATVRHQARSGEARRVREAANISRALVAEALGVGEDTFMRWENGARAPRDDVALRYADMLDELRRIAQ